MFIAKVKKIDSKYFAVCDWRAHGKPWPLGRTVSRAMDVALSRHAFSTFFAVSPPLPCASRAVRRVPHICRELSLQFASSHYFAVRLLDICRMMLLCRALSCPPHDIVFYAVR
jgi:hypothetical protein